MADKTERGDLRGTSLQETVGELSSVLQLKAASVHIHRDRLGPVRCLSSVAFPQSGWTSGTLHRPVK